MFSQVQQALEHLSAAVGAVDQTPTGELRRTLGLAKALRSRVELLETKAASLVAQREQHGDGGAGLLNQLGGVSRSEAARNVRTDAELEQIPAARDGVSQGEISLANAARLARAARSTSPQAVQDDAELVEQARALPPDEFAKAAQRWTLRHQHGDELAAQHRRNRRNRHVRFWNGEDGSVQMRGSFDAEMGARIQNRLHRQAELLRQSDRRRARNGGTGGAEAGGAGSGGAETSGAGSGGARRTDSEAVRTRDQRMADALDQAVTASTPAPAAVNAPATAPPNDTPPASTPAADTPMANAPTSDVRTAIDAHSDTAPDLAPATHTPTAATPTNDASPVPTHTEAASELAPTADMPPAGISVADAPPAATPHRAPAAQIIVRADLDLLLGEPGGIAEIAGAGPIPASTVERLMCNSDLSVVLFGDKLTPLYETTPARAPTAAQRRALIARDRECIGCGAPPDECEAHHIIPWQCRGKTRLDNLVLVCWFCHDRIHDHNWRVIIRDSRYRLAPPLPENQPADTPHEPADTLLPDTPHQPANTLPIDTLPLEAVEPAAPHEPADTLLPDTPHQPANTLLPDTPNQSADALALDTPLLDARLPGVLRC